MLAVLLKSFIKKIHSFKSPIFMHKDGESWLSVWLDLHLSLWACLWRIFLISLVDVGRPILGVGGTTEYPCPDKRKRERERTKRFYFSFVWFCIVWWQAHLLWWIFAAASDSAVTIPRWPQHSDSSAVCHGLKTMAPQESSKLLVPDSDWRIT